MFNAFNTVITVDPITAPRQLGETVVVTDIADPRAVTLEAVADRDAASAGTPSPVTAAIGIAPGSTVRIVKYCVDPAGSVTLVLATTDRSAVRVHVQSPSGTPGNWTISVVTASASVLDVHTDYVVATDADPTYVTLRVKSAMTCLPT